MVCGDCARVFAPFQLALTGLDDAVQPVAPFVADHESVVESGAGPDVGEAVKVVTGTGVHELGATVVAGVVGPEAEVPEASVAVIV